MDNNIKSAHEELWDLYDKDLEKVKIGHSKHEKIPEDLYHLAVEIWAISSDNKMLLIKRAGLKKVHPGKWECIGGSVITGEDFINAAIRELHEEIGLVVDRNELSEICPEVRNGYIVMTYILWKDIDVPFLALNPIEVEECAWFTQKEFDVLCSENKFVPFLIRRFVKFVKPKLNKRYIDNKPASIKRLLENNKVLSTAKRGLPNAGNRADGAEFYPDLKKICDSFKIYGNKLYDIVTLFDGESNISNSIGGGSPALGKPFPTVKEAINRLLDSDALSQYPLAAGDKEARCMVKEYLLREGFSPQLTEDNIIFTVSTTQAFWHLTKLILRPYDVMLFTAPTYGLLAFIPEREGGISKFIELRKEDNWYINEKLLADRIDELNYGLECEYAGKLDYVPRVAGFLNINPHNPTGKVMSVNHIKKIEAIARTCMGKSVIVIDDILYRDLCYDRSNLPLPVAALDDYFNNTISLLGVSKSYGLAGVRAGIIVADEVIIRGIRDDLFQVMDSPPHLQASILSSVFNTSSTRVAAYNDYFNALIPEYEYRCNLMLAIIEGVLAVKVKYREEIIKDIHQYYYDAMKEKWILSGIDGVRVVEGMVPESGFFLMVDFTGLKGKSEGNFEITDDENLLYYLYHKAKIKFILGKSIAWPDENQIIGRLTYAIERNEIISVMEYLKDAIEKLE